MDMFEIKNFAQKQHTDRFRLTFETDQNLSQISFNKKTKMRQMIEFLYTIKFTQSQRLRYRVRTHSNKYGSVVRQHFITALKTKMAILSKITYPRNQREQLFSIYSQDDLSKAATVWTVFHLNSMILLLIA